MRFLWRVLGVALFNFVFVKRQWMWILQNVIIALGVLFIALGWGGAVAVKTLVPIYIVISAWGFGLNIVAQMVGYDRVVREWERLVASPLQLIEYFTGLTLGTLPLMVSSLAPPILLYSLWSLDLRSVAIALLISPIAMILGSFLSLSIVLRIRNPMNISAITNPLMSVTTFLPPVLYPPTVLPEPLRSISAAIPTVALSEVTRLLSTGTCTIPIQLTIASTAAWLTATAIATLKALKWGLE
jgi:ABC-2 type transport system permease protein